MTFNCCQPEREERLRLHLPHRKVFMGFTVRLFNGSETLEGDVSGQGLGMVYQRQLESILDHSMSRHMPLILFTRLCPLTCGRSYDVPGGGLRHGVGQSLSEALFTGLCRAKVVPGNAETFRPASTHFQQGHAAPIKWTCTQTHKHTNMT